MLQIAGEVWSHTPPRRDGQPVHETPAPGRSWENTHLRLVLQAVALVSPGTRLGISRSLAFVSSVMKNPWMSLWLSAANTSAGAARGFWTAETRRQQKNLLKELTGQARSGRSAPAKKSSAAKRRTKTSR